MSACYKKPFSSPGKCAMEKLFKWKKVILSVLSDLWLGTILSTDTKSLTLLRRIIQACFQEVKRTLVPSPFKEAESGVFHWLGLRLSSVPCTGFSDTRTTCSPNTETSPLPSGFLENSSRCALAQIPYKSHTLHVGPPLYINTDSIQPSQRSRVF